MGKSPDFTYDYKIPMKTLLDDASDFDLVNSTFVKIGGRYGHWVDAALYTPAERTIMLVWHSIGIIDNGGFEYLFSDSFDGDPEFKITAEAYRTVGLARAYEAFLEAFQLFPDSKVPHDAEQRIHQYKAASESTREKINSMFWDEHVRPGEVANIKSFLVDHRAEVLANYIREHIVEFGDLDGGSKSSSESNSWWQFWK